jgi:hypothetical protein
MPASIAGSQVLGIYLQQLQRNLGTLQNDVMEWVNSDVVPLAQSKTHRITGKLKAGWFVEKRGSGVTLSNNMPYARLEFARPGSKISGTQADIGTPHNPLPEISDFISANIQPIIMQSIFGTR